MKMGDDPAGSTAGQVIVDILMTSVYAASLAAFHKAIDILVTNGSKNGVKMLESSKTIPSDRPLNTSSYHPSNSYDNDNLSDGDLMRYYR